MSAHKMIHKIDSKSLQRNVIVGVVIPSTIDMVVILLHGHNGSFDILEKNLPLLELADNNHAMIVTPDMNNGYYIDHDGYSVSEFVAKELPDMIFDTYNLKHSMDLYISGISMGGFGSLLIGSKYPEFFKKIISISGAFIAKDVAIGNPALVGKTGDMEMFAYYSRTFAPFDTLEESEDRNAVAGIINCSKKRQIPEIILSCGTEDPLCVRNVETVRDFCTNYIKCDWYPIDGGLHDYKCFDEGLRYMFKKIEGCG